MIWKNIELYNVSELRENGKGGYDMLRIPSDVARELNERACLFNKCNCCCELRFRITEGEAEITLQIDSKDKMCLMPVVYYGGIGAGCQDCVKRVYDGKTVIKIPKQMENHEHLIQIHKDNDIPYSPELVRVILPVGMMSIVDVKGKVEPPHEGDAPKKRYLAYGSSITHGSISILPNNSWTFRVAENLRADLINLGFAGAAHLEPAIGEYIAKRNDFDFVTLEMGINIAGIEVSDFESRVKNLISTVASAHPDKDIYCIDIPFCKLDMEHFENVEKFREIVKNAVEELGFKNTMYISGKSLLDKSDGLSADFIHPNVRGVEKIAKKLTEILAANANI